MPWFSISTAITDKKNCISIERKHTGNYLQHLIDSCYTTEIDGSGSNVRNYRIRTCGLLVPITRLQRRFVSSFRGILILQSKREKETNIESCATETDRTGRIEIKNTLLLRFRRRLSVIGGDGRGISGRPVPALWLSKMEIHTKLV